MVNVAGLRHPGLALSTSSVAFFSFVVLFLVLRARIGGVHGRHLVATTSKVVAASAAMGVVVWLSSSAITGWLGERLTGRLADLAISIPGGIAIFYGLCRLMKVDELDLAVRAAAGPLARRLRPRA
jgi:peptidoglycan biosynthesis protein MviN/MurJ (putative lipid II flippase)